MRQLLLLFASFLLPQILALGARRVTIRERCFLAARCSIFVTRNHSCHHVSVPVQARLNGGNTYRPRLFPPCLHFDSLSVSTFARLAQSNVEQHILLELASRLVYSTATVAIATPSRCI